MYMLKAVFLKIESISEFPGGLVRTQMAGHSPRVSDLAGLKILVSEKYSGAADAAGLGPFS